VLQAKFRQGFLYSGTVFKVF